MITLNKIFTYRFQSIPSFGFSKLRPAGFSFDLRPDPHDRTAQKHCTITSSSRTAWRRRTKKSESTRPIPSTLQTNWWGKTFPELRQLGVWSNCQHRRLNHPRLNSRLTNTEFYRRRFVTIKNGDTTKMSAEIKTSQRRASHGEWFWQFCRGLHHQAGNQVTNSQTDGPVERQRTDCSSRYAWSLSEQLCWRLKCRLWLKKKKKKKKKRRPEKPM